MTATTSTGRKVRAGGEKRGNCRDRAARRAWMLRTWGDGVKCPCVEADRIVPGGSYRRENVQPACRSCNLARSNDIEWSY
jgi:dTDP-4-amino-4,6-dideoxygalactose transaminase